MIKASTITLIYACDENTVNNRAQLISLIQTIIEHNNLAISLSIVSMQDEPMAQKHDLIKITNKFCKIVSEYYQKPVLLIDGKLNLSLLIEGIRVAPNWAGMQKRVVSAGRKSELLLQSTKLTSDDRVLDATAGFGHDSLILGSTGAKVTMLEREPLLVLMLLVEQAQMRKQKNWQKLMSRLTIINMSAEDYLDALSNATDGKNNTEKNYEVIYLDPMFPEHSYNTIKSREADQVKNKGAKVGKHMQALHGLVKPPNRVVEQKLFNKAYCALEVNSDSLRVINSMEVSDESHTEGYKTKRLIIKRPISAPHFAEQTPDETWQNDVVRFDGYFIKSS